MSDWSSDVCSSDLRVADEGVGCFAISLILRLVLGPDIAAFGLESTVAVDADERARASDFGGIVDDGPLFEIVEFGLDLAQPPVALLGKLPVGIRLAFFTLPHSVAQGFALCLLLLRPLPPFAQHRQSLT